MHHFYSICLTTIAVVNLVPPATAHKFIIDNSFLNHTLLPSMGLGGDNWEEKLQIEGLGIAQSLIFLLQDKYPAAQESLEELKKHKILFVGGFGGNALGGWVAAVILAAFGIQCDLYVIQEQALPLPKAKATPFSTALLRDIVENPLPNLKFVHRRGLDTCLDDESLEIAELSEVLRNEGESAPNLNTVIYTVLMDGKKYQMNDKSEYSPFELVNIETYSLVLDGITGASQDDKDFKLGTVWALMILKQAERINGNILVSTDFPSLWKDGTPELAGKYRLFGIGPLMPFAIIHIGAMKPYVLNNDYSLEKMLHYVVVPKVLEESLADSSSHEFKITYGEHVTSGKMLEISSSTSKSSNVYIKFPYKNVVVDIKTLLKGNEREKSVLAHALAKYKDNLTAGIAVAA